MQTRNRISGRANAGGALIFAAVALVLVSGLALSLLSIAQARHSETNAAVEHSRARYLAEAGLSRSIAAVTSGLGGTFGDAGAPIAFAGGAYWTEAIDNKDGTATVRSYGAHNALSLGLEAVLVKQIDNVYSSALFAGNSSKDPLYDLKFGGLGAQADDINGNIYSGGNVVVNGGATIDGAIKAEGTITGASGSTGKGLAIPDIAGMNYAVNNNIDVAKQFATGGASYSSSGGMGGSAWQLPQSNPAHIFRKNPSDRTSATSSTTKDDYFLEDPYGSLSGSSITDAAHASKIHLSGVDGAPGPNGNNAVYYIDGNLWIHNLSAYSFTFENAKGTPTDITLVVNGNVYFSDNILYGNPAKDGVAIIAVKDPAEKDSGNIYFGDPTFGTLEQMDAFMYAENDFFDTNLSASGSATVTVNGNMTAGNEVLINRDFGAQHSKLTVNYDDRIAKGTITLPGLPKNGTTGSTWSVASWREIQAP